MCEELKPCPFCGGEPNLTNGDYVHDNLSPMPVVECKSCSAWVRVEDWNRRAQPAESEGVEALSVLEADFKWPDEEIVVRQSDHLAALSAVTAERDRLLSDNASLRGSCKALGEENKQLKRENKRQGRTIAAMDAKEE